MLKRINSMNKPLPLLTLLLLSLTACDSEQPTATNKVEPTKIDTVMPATKDEAVESVATKEESKPTPVAESVNPPTPVVAAPAMTGEGVYKKYCFVCHQSGVANAPKLGDKAAWAARKAKGLDKLMQSALNGIPGTAMPAMGNCRSCSDDELSKAIDYMLSQSQ
jgi:cytochrome c5